MEHNDREVFMPPVSNNERTATVDVTRLPERLVGPFQGSERLMTLLEVSQLLGVPVATLYRWRQAVRRVPDWTSCSIPAGGCGGVDRGAG
jgi:hypothetical protein